MDIKDKVVIVTGASQGIGLATAKYLTIQEAKVVLAARSEDKLVEIAKGLPHSLPLKVDMTSDSDIKMMIDKTMEKYGRIDILINNAGQGLYSSVENINLEDYKKIMDLNVYSIIKMMQAVIPIMRRQGHGTIINVSSAVTRNYFPGLAGYASTKYALNAISYTARQELAADNIIVSVILPKITSSNFAENAVGARPQAIKDRIKNRLNEIIIDTPETVAAKISELISSGQPDLFV